MDVASSKADYEHYGRFIPLTRHAVIADLCQDPDGKVDAIDDFARLAVKLQAHRARQYDARAEAMRRTYLPFSPDRDTVRVLPFSESQTAAMEGELIRQLDELLERANYEVLKEADINDVISNNQPYSLRVTVDLSEFERFRLYFRDEYEEDFTVRRPEWAYLRKATYQVGSFRRLFLVLKLKSEKDQVEALMAQRQISRWRAGRSVRRKRAYLPKGSSSDFIYLRVFKDIPKHDVQLLFPNRKVAFRPFDKLKFGVTAGGGTLMGIVTTITKIAATTSPFAIVAAMVAFIGVVGRQVASFFNTRTRYMAELSQKLFFHALASNRAALTLLLDRAEEEDVKEDLITLYFFAGMTVPESGIAERRRHIEDVFLTRYNVGLDFDVYDSLARLERDGVVTRTEEGTRVFPDLAASAAFYERLLSEQDEADISRVCDDPPAAAVVLQEA